MAFDTWRNNSSSFELVQTKWTGHTALLEKNHWTLMIYFLEQETMGRPWKFITNRRESWRMEDSVSENGTLILPMWCLRFQGLKGRKHDELCSRKEFTAGIVINIYLYISLWNTQFSLMTAMYLWINSLSIYLSIYLNWCWGLGKKMLGGCHHINYTAM